MRNKSIYVIIKGRSGNQLFQYAFARVIQELTGGDLILDFSEMGFNKSIGNYGPDKHMDNVLDCFNVHDYSYVDAGSKYKGCLFHRIQLLFYRLFRKIYITFPNKTEYIAKISSGLLQRAGVYYQFGTNSFLDYRKPSKWLNSFLIRGWFESANYFESIKSLIKNELHFSFNLPPSLDYLQQLLIDEESICVSIRRGDFVSDTFKKEFLICDNDYYYNGISYIINKLDSAKDSVLLVCSDDIEWCKNNIKFPINRIVYEPQGLTTGETLHLMTMCHHFVISNSTFSFWAQYLASFPNKIVVAPSIWRRCTPPIKDIFMSEWVLMD